MRTFRHGTTAITLVFFLRALTASADDTLSTSAAAAKKQARKPTAALATKVALDDDDREVLERGEVTTGQMVAGGLVGTFVFPFGVGQAIEGRYGDAGWIFTVSELGSLGILVAGAAASSCSGGNLAAVNGYSTITPVTCSTSPLLWVGLGGFVVSRVAEIIDVWVGPSTHNAKYQRAKLKQEQGAASIEPYLAPIGTQSLAMGLQIRL